ncbi:MAG: type II toxin-antitoxin system RelE/ParE family toxin [Rhizobiaceae bacterium]
MRLVRSQFADNDIESIADYIAQDNPNAALRWIDDIEEKLNAIAETPKLGAHRPEIMEDLRTVALGKYIICYRPIVGGAEILRVFHGARQWQDLL